MGPSSIEGAIKSFCGVPGQHILHQASLDGLCRLHYHAKGLVELEVLLAAFLKLRQEALPLFCMIRERIVHLQHGVGICTLLRILGGVVLHQAKEALNGGPLDALIQIKRCLRVIGCDKKSQPKEQPLLPKEMLQQRSSLSTKGATSPIGCI